MPITRALAASILMLLVVLGAGSWFAFTQIRNAALQRVTAAAFLMEAHAIGTLDAADQAVQRAIDLIGDRDLDSLREDQALWRRLRAVADTQPIIVMLRLLDEAGETVLETTHFPSDRINLAGEPLFIEPHAGAKRYVGAAVTDPTVGTPVFTLSHRVESRDGGFRGVILAALDAAHFSGVYRRIDPAPTSAAGLVEEEDGNFLAREPAWSQFVGQSLGPWNDFLRRQERIGSGLFQAASPVDQVWRYYAYRRVEGYPLVVFAGESKKEVMWLWLLYTGAMAGGTLLGTAGILYFGRAARLAWLRERRAAWQLRETNARLEQALTDKDLLFREVHHRVKNNLQVVSNLLLLQGQRVRDEEARAAFQETMDRLQSVSAVHQVLYRTNQAVEIELGRYLADLCATLAASYGAAERGIDVRVEGDSCRVHIDQAIPLALIVNEAVTNAFKYAFPNGGGGVLRVTLTCRAQELHLSISDSGVGLPEGATAGDSLGMNLISSLAVQLDGSHRWQTGPGSRLEICVPRRALAEPAGGPGTGSRTGN